MKRTLDNCRMVTRYGRPNQYDGKCEGFCKSREDDEPCKPCIDCELHYANIDDKEATP